MLKNNFKNVWTTEALDTVTSVKHFLSNLSVLVRTDQYEIFKKITKPKAKYHVLDVGVTSYEILKDSNIFERLYNYPNNIVAATVESPEKFRKLYPNIKTVKIVPNKRLPFKNKSFDIVTAWATIEHVGDYKKQEFFLSELIRVGRKVFLTTPYRGCIYEPHSGLFFIHWLPLSLFRWVCRKTGKKFWSKEDNLNPLYFQDLKRMKINKYINISIYNMFGFIPSHLIIRNK